MGLLRAWRDDRVRRRRSAAYAATMHAEPDDSAVRWLAEVGTNGDQDHASWELRYARRAIGLLVARRDALDDRTPSLVASALAECFARDRRIDPGKRAVAERQFNIRLRAYREAMERRERPVSSTERMAEVLLAFAGQVALAGDERVRRGAEILAGYMTEAHEALRREFGEASLPEDVLPSTIRT
jgi:hypothetical protein